MLAARAQGTFGATVDLEGHGILQRVAQASYGLVFYAFRTLWPTNLSPLYELEIDLDPTQPVYMGAMVTVALFACVLPFLRRKHPGVVAAFVIYAVTVAPVLGILQSGAQIVADRYTYLACLPFALLLGAGARSLLERGGVGRARVLISVSLVVALVLGTLTWRQTLVWRDSESLWRHVIRLHPSSYIAHHNLAGEFQKSGRITEAIESEKRSIEAHPGKGNEQTRHSLGSLYMRVGQRDAALEAWRGALKVAPTHEPSIQAVVADLQRQGDFGAALAVWEQAIAFDPDFMEGYRQKALMLLNSGKGLQAEDTLRRAVARNPNYAPAWHGLGTIVYSSGRHEEGEGYLRQALRAEISADTLAELARVLSLKPDDASMGQAEVMLRQALALDANHARARELARELGLPTP